MRFRLRIRTLMLVVLGVALVCALLAELPEVLLRLGMIALNCMGPAIGAVWAGVRYRPGRLDPISGGMMGGAVQTGMLLAAGIFSALKSHGDIVPYLPELGMTALFLLAFHVVIGGVVGGFISRYVLALKHPPLDAEPSESPPRP